MNSLLLFNNVVLQLSKLESFQVHYQLLVLLVTILETGFLELLRLVGFLFVFLIQVLCVSSSAYSFFFSIVILGHLGINGSIF